MVERTWFATFERCAWVLFPGIAVVCLLQRQWFTAGVGATLAVAYGVPRDGEAKPWQQRVHRLLWIPTLALGAIVVASFVA